MDLENKVCAICDCTHSWDVGEVTLQPTCLAEGSAVHTCVLCGVTEQRVLEKAGHTPGPEATAREDQTCTVCGAILTPATGQDGNKAPAGKLLVAALVALCLGGIACGIYIGNKRKAKA